jgi:hypothetical protein
MSPNRRTAIRHDHTPSPFVNEPNRSRTIIVLTRLSTATLHVTYCNALVEATPYCMTVVVNETDAPFTMSGVKPSEIPEVGQTKVVWD